MSKFEAVILDMDGTIIDSEVFAFTVWKEALKTFNIELERNVFTQMIGRSAKDSNLVLSGYYPEVSPDLIRKKVREIEHLAYEKTPIDEKDGATELLNYLKYEKKIKLALATSTEQSRAKARLAKLSLLDYFDVRIYGDMVINAKPDPEIYLKAAKSLGVNIENCLVVEDSPAGVHAGIKSKAKVIWIKDMLEIPEELKGSLYLQLNNLLEIKNLFLSEEN